MLPCAEVYATSTCGFVNPLMCGGNCCLEIDQCSIPGNSLQQVASNYFSKTSYYRPLHVLTWTNTGHLQCRTLQLSDLSFLATYPGPPPFNLTCGGPGFWSYNIAGCGYISSCCISLTPPTQYKIGASYETRNGKRNETQKWNGMGNEMTILYPTWNFFCPVKLPCLCLPPS